MPKIIEIGAEGCQVLKKHHALLKKMGIDLKFFGENTIVIEALPSSMNDEEASVLIFELTDELRGSSGKLMENSALKLLQSAALRRDHRLSFIEANHLLDALMLCQRPLLCPKGRSVIKIVGVKELEKW